MSLKVLPSELDKVSQKRVARDADRPCMLGDRHELLLVDSHTYGGAGALTAGWFRGHSHTLPRSTNSCTVNFSDVP
jgi:hypothetical protein